MGKDDATQEPPAHQPAKPDEPQDVLADPALSKDQKAEVLGTLEQDARQLSVAADEGMAGGDPDQLHDVLDAKTSLEMPATEHAYAVVVQDLQDRLSAGVTDGARRVLEQALTALGAVARLAAADTPSAGSEPVQGGRPKPGSAREMEDEIAREKLDP